ncbi:hypothetical protein [Maribacter sp.]|nr:hypothetical protein [Maribacter sp.]
MKTNMGLADRLIRALFAIAIALFYYEDIISETVGSKILDKGKFVL